MPGLIHCDSNVLLSEMQKKRGLKPTNESETAIQYICKNDFRTMIGHQGKKTYIIRVISLGVSIHYLDEKCSSDTEVMGA